MKGISEKPIHGEIQMVKQNELNWMELDGIDNLNAILNSKPKKKQKRQQKPREREREKKKSLLNWSSWRNSCIGK